MRAKLYNSIKARLAEVAAIKHIGIWNDNIADLSGGLAFARPAVFISFEDINWTQGGYWLRRGEVSIDLHLITDYLPPDGTREDLSHFELIDEITRTLAGFCEDYYSGLQLTTSSTDHNHSELLHNIERWTTTVEDVVARRPQAAQPIDTLAVRNE